MNFLPNTKLIKILDPESSGSIDIQNLVSPIQKQILKQIPFTQRTQIAMVLKNFVYKYKTFSMPLRLFFKQYRKSLSTRPSIDPDCSQSDIKTTQTPRVKLVLNKTICSPNSSYKAQKVNQMVFKPSTPQARIYRNPNNGCLDICTKKFVFKESPEVQRRNKRAIVKVRQRKQSDPFLVRYSDIQGILEVRKQHLEFSKRIMTTQQVMREIFLQ